MKLIIYELYFTIYMWLQDNLTQPEFLTLDPGTDKLYFSSSYDPKVNSTTVGSLTDSLTYLPIMLSFNWKCESEIHPTCKLAFFVSYYV